MATEDINKKNTPEEEAGKTKNNDEPQGSGDTSKATVKKTEPDEEEIETTSAAADTEMPTELDSNVKELTPEEIEEAIIDEEETEFSSTGDCRCQEIDGDYYCFKLKQGRWIQWSVIPYPTKKMCEAICCKA